MPRKKAQAILLASTILLGSCTYKGKDKTFVQLLENKSVYEIQKGLEEIIKPNIQIIKELEQKQKKQWLRFAVIGDTLSDNNLTYKEMLARISAMSPSPEFIVNLGDFSTGSPEGYSYYISTIKNYPRPIIHMIGNHETEEGGEIIAKALFGERDFSFDYNDVRFVFMGTHEQGLTIPRLEWLEEKIKYDYPSKKIFLTHKFPVKPFKDLFKGIYSLFVQERKNEGKLLEMLDMHNIDLAFYGHLHRFKAITYRGTAMIISGGGGQRSSIEPRDKQPLSTKEKNFTLVDLLAEEGYLPQGVITCINRYGEPLFMSSFYESKEYGEGKGSNWKNGEASIHLVPYIPADNNLVHPPYIERMYNSYLSYLEKNIQKEKRK
jgi:predicted phosphodiesterase